MWIERCRKQYFKLWAELTGWKLLLFYIVHFTILFLILAWFIFLPFLKAEKGFIWRDDGLPQHFMRLLYISRTFRESLRSFFSGNGWNFPLYDFHFGLTAQDMQIGFPQILAVLWPEQKINIFYYLYVLFNYYMVGVSFSIFGFFFHQKPVSIITGAVAYAFCGYSLSGGVRHPYYLMPMICLPLLVVGTEQVLHKQKAWLLTGMVFLSLTAQFGVYFSCMQMLFISIYICVRFWDLYDEERIREFLKMVGRMFVWGGTGVLLGCFSAIPALLQIGGSGRIGKDVASFSNMLHYKADFYQRFLLEFMVIPNGFSVWAILGFSVITLPAVLLLFLRREQKERSPRILFAIFTIALGIPGVAYVMSGFSNISSRYCFGYAFLVSTILMFMVPHFADMEYSMMAAVGMLLVIYFMVCHFIFKHNAYQMRPFTMLLMAVMLFACCNLAGAKGRKWIPVGCLLITCFSVWYTSYLKYNPDEGNYVKEFVNGPYTELGRGQYASLASSTAVKEDVAFYRVTGDNITTDELNASFLYGLNGLSAYPYYGLSNSYMEWLAEMETARSRMQHRIYDLDERSTLVTLAGVKYYAERKTQSSFAPYGFVETEEIQKDDNKDLIWKNEHNLPLGYTYENYIGRQQYNELNALGKQEAQLQTVVLEEEPICDLPEKTNLAITAEQILYEIADMKDLSWENGKIVVQEPGAVMTLTFSGIPKTETYLRVIGLDLTEGDSSRNWWLKADTDATSATAGFCADAFVYTHGQKTQMLNLGYSEDGHHTVKITFPEKGTFLLQNIEIWCQPMDYYAKEIDKLREETLENVKISGRGVIGTLSVTKNKFLCLSVPYMDGWKAYVDGKEVKLYRANTAFMGVEIPAGEHVVELRYWIPGLTIGICLSGVGVICLFVIMVFPYIAKKHFRKNEER